MTPLMHYLVTGGAGFIGTNTVVRLLKDGHSVRVLDNFSAGKKLERMQEGAEYIEGDIRNMDDLAPAMQGIDGVFHLAAVPRVPYSVEHPAETHEHNLTGTVNVLIAARDAKVKRIVFASSSAAYGDQAEYPLHEDMIPKPVSPYGLQKLASEEYCRLACLLYGLETVSLRYFNVYGPYMDPEGPYALVVGKFLRQRERGEPLTICGDGEYYRAYSHVSDVVEANIRAMTSPKVGKGEVINVGGGKPYSVNDLAKLLGGPTATIPPRSGDMRYTAADNTRAQELLGWEPKIALEDGIAMLKKEWGIG